MRDTLKHAFAVDPPGPAEPTEQEKPAVEWFCRQVARRHLTTPGLIALEMSRPLNFLASQFLNFAAPGVWALARQQTFEGYTHFAAFLERRGAIEYLARRIEEIEGECRDREHPLPGPPPGRGRERGTKTSPPPSQGGGRWEGDLTPP